MFNILDFSGTQPAQPAPTLSESFRIFQNLSDLSRPSDSFGNAFHPRVAHLQHRWRVHRLRAHPALQVLHGEAHLRNGRSHLALAGLAGLAGLAVTGICS